MMGLIFFLLMMIPISMFNKFRFNNQFMYLILYIFLLLINNNTFFSSISYSFGMDNYSYWLIMMSFLISSYMVISMLKGYKVTVLLNINLFLNLFLVIIFSTLSFMHMYISFEFVLVPLVVLILGWGYQPERLMAGLYLFLYTLFVSLPLLGLLLYLYMLDGTLFFDAMKYNSCLFFIHFVLMIVFMVKLPMFMVHFWLPKAHVQAPVSGSMILAGVMLSIGGYGLIRSMFLYENMFISYSYIWYSLSMIGAMMIGLVCLIQGDMKMMIAYSSISHMGMVIMGILTMSIWGLMGSFLLMVGHGFCSSGLFYLANLLYIRSGSRSFYINSGMINFMPSCSMMWFVYCTFNMSCPPSINFLSEFMILSSMMYFWKFSLIFFVGISFFCACFSYYLFSFSQHGLYHNLYSFSNINMMEFLCLFMHLMPLFFCPLIIMCIF
uniref:NADH-ubiquinone oxidoreductase chain 4 n=1 Tax=Cicadula sp. EMHAU-2015-Zz052713 TaxID=2038642 RepID=A0A343K5Z5_9HEMI|nr:NADH dehydrogenase subunit 4 [Cicadula sp. EMHAU-2015-Zz052713]